MKNFLGVERYDSFVTTRFRIYELKTTNSCNFAYAKLNILCVTNKGFRLEPFHLRFFELHPFGRL